MKLFKKIHIQKYNKIKHFFKCEDGFALHNLRFNIKWCEHNPKKQKLHIQIWLPFIHIVRDNSKWEFGNECRLVVYH